MFNFPLEVAVFAVVFAQFIKLPIQYFIDKKWYFSIIFSTGGMPSSHSAFVTALTIALALTEGITSPVFAISFVFAGVVIHDAIGIRREAGKHAFVLNQMRDEIDSIIHEVSKKDERDNLIIETKLKELLGHEPIEAIAGTLLGAIIAVSAYFLYIY